MVQWTGVRFVFPLGELIFNDIRFLGFWLDRWKKRQTPEDLRKEIDRVLQLLALDQVRYSIDQTFELRQIQGAWARNQESDWVRWSLCRIQKTRRQILAKFYLVVQAEKNICLGKRCDFYEEFCAL